MNDWLHSKPINDVMTELPIDGVIPDARHVTLGSSAKVVLTHQGHGLNVQASERLRVKREALILELLFLRECNAASPRTCPCMIPAENKVLGNKSALMCCHFNCWQIKSWHMWWLRSYSISAESVRRQMDLFPWNRLVVISFHGHINPLEDEVLSRDTPSVLSTANVKH